LSTMIESHVLERNKFRHKYPAIDTVSANSDIEGALNSDGPKDSCIQTPRKDAEIISKFTPGHEMDFGNYNSLHFRQKRFSTLLSMFKHNPSSEEGNFDTSRSTEWWRKSAERHKADEISSGDSTVRLSLTYTDAIGAGVILLGHVVTGADATEGGAPSIFPFRTNALTISASAIAADAITATSIAAGTITATEIDTSSISADILDVGTVVVGEVGDGGSPKSNVQITGGAINLRTNTTNKVSLSTAGVLTMGDFEVASDGGMKINGKILFN